MKVSAICCPKCKNIIYSRARHDCRSCSCGEVYIDGVLIIQELEERHYIKHFN